jgi:uncharacterized membrane protein YagU involved in acid resistance
MQVRNAIADIGVGLLAGFAGTKLMEPVSMKLYEWEPDEARRQEDAVRPGPPYQVAADKLSEQLGLRDKLSESQQKKLGMAFHYGLGMSWGPIYTLLARKSGLNPVVAGLLTGAAMSLVMDEIVTPAMGYSAPNRDYPMVTHLRGFVAHLVFGMGVAATAELVLRLLGEENGAVKR